MTTPCPLPLLSARVQNAFGSVGMVVVPLLGFDSEGIRFFDGDLKGFVEASKASASMVTVEVRNFTEVDLAYEDGSDLLALNPDLAGFKAKLGVEMAVLVVSRNPFFEFGFLLEADWVNDFEKAKAAAVEKFNERSNTASESDGLNREAVRRDLASKLEVLLVDPEFVKLTTLRAMKLYALQKFSSEMSGLEDAVVVACVQWLRDQLEIQGKLKRKRP